MSGDRWVYEIEPGGGDPAELVSVAERAVARGDRELAATAYDRAYALSPDSAAVATSGWVRSG
jgi:cytochrome c-type biogenesis protein CcmH/NrfG